MQVRLPRRWAWRGVVAGIILAAAAYGRYRSRSGAASSAPPAITERDAAAFLVRRRVDPDGLESVREAVARLVSRGDPEPVLGIAGASTASMFLDLDGDPALVWYVEVPRPVAARWDDPRSTVAGAFPVEHDAVASSASATEFLDGAVDRELLVHAANPTRPRAAVRDGDGGPLVLGPDDAGVDVDLVRLRLKPGLPERLADRFAGVSRRVAAGDLELGPIETQSAAMLEAEEMYTESIFLERRADGYVLWGYMETAAMEGVYDAYYDTRNPVARLSEVVLGAVLEDPSEILEYPLETDVSLLAHAVDPNRPRRPGEC